MTDIKQEWIGSAETAIVAYMEKTYHARQNPTNSSIAKAAVRAVAPLIRADALREAAAQASREKVLVASAEAMAGKCEEMIELEMNIATMASSLVSGLISDDILALIDAPKMP